MGLLEGKVTLITGGSKGIGEGLVKKFIEEGARVVFSYRSSEAQAEKIIKELNTSSVLAFQSDAANFDEANDLVTKVVDAFGQLDILVNNAGISRERTVRNMSLDEWKDVIDTNLNSVFYCSQSVIPQMIENKQGTIINIASLLGQIGNIGLANYSASKGGVLAFTRGLALELARHNITVNSICPGWIKKMNTSINIQKAAPAKKA